MGSAFDSWAAVKGAYYMGAGTSWEVIWTVVALVVCLAALAVGSRHELDAYKKMESRKSD
ncbi:MAG: hypothetical protein AAF468_16870 [Pseudomonadota bacterium]